MNNFKKLPQELQTEILSYIIRCKADNNLFINRELNHINNKYKKCKFITMFGKQVCSGCWKKELKQISLMFSNI